MPSSCGGIEPITKNNLREYRNIMAWFDEEFARRQLGKEPDINLNFGGLKLHQDLVD